MPRQVDHKLRRRQITDALCRITVKGGLAEVSFRQVAEEAGVSVALIQHYFGTKDELLLAAWRHLSARVTNRIFDALADAGTEVPPRAALRIVLEEFIPTDQDRSEAALLFIAFHTASLTDPSLARAEAREVPRELATFVTSALRDAQKAGTLAAGVDPDHEGVVVVSLIIGLAHMILSGTYPVADGVRIAGYAVDRLFRPGD